MNTPLHPGYRVHKSIFAVLWCFVFSGSMGCRTTKSTAPMTPNMSEWNKWMKELNQSSRDSLTHVIAPPHSREKTVHLTTAKLETLLEEIPSWVSLLETEPVVRDGRTVGLKVGRIGTRDPLRTLGLNSRDIVVGIAGVHINSADAGHRALTAAHSALDNDGYIDVIRIDKGPVSRVRARRVERTRFVAHNNAPRPPEWFQGLEENAQQFATKETFIEETIRLTPNQLKTHVDQLPPSLKKIRTTTVEHNEEAIGIRLNAVRLSHPLSRLGMQRNDIILSVADTALGAAEALKTAETQSRLLAEQNTPIDVVLRRDDQTLLMRFVTEEPVLSWPDWMAVLNQPLADAIDALTLSKAPTPQEPITVTKQWLEAALDTPPGWLSALPLQPRTSNGVTIGLDASGIGEHFAAHHLGLEDADVVVELAGVHLASTEALSEAREAIRQAIATDTDIHLVVLLRTELPTAARFTIEVVNSEPLQPDCPVSKCWRAHPMDDEEPTAPTK